ncbi:hypothetical protein GQ44DRAFT_716384, partial [Phaeosphaeriaceae sp. PMI808]
MGQVPPTPIADSARDGEVIIMTQDLRRQCRAVSGEKKMERVEPVKSPKKKIFGMNLPTFGRISSNGPAPSMPSKAAQVLGQVPRNASKVVVRPIKPARPVGTPTKAPRSETSKSLPAKLLNQDTHVQRYHRNTARRNRTASRKSPPRGIQQPRNTENIPPVPNLKSALANSSFESGPPPTPPAKDTPPDGRALVQPPSPLRRSAPFESLRERYETNNDSEAQLQLPLSSVLFFAPTKPFDSEIAGKSPTKHVPYTAEEYQLLIRGTPLSWVSPVKTSDDDSSTSGLQELKIEAESQNEEGLGEMTEEQNKSPRSIPANEDLFIMQWSEEQPIPFVKRNSLHYNSLLPRFYSPSNRSVQLFAEGETPSKNSDTKRLLCTVSPRAEPSRPLHNSSSGLIDMVFQGDVDDIDPQSSTARLVNGNEATMLARVGDDSGLAARVRQDLRIGEPYESLRQNVTGHLQPDQSSSRLTDMLHGISPQRGDFLPNCPSAVPSPLIKIAGSVTPMQRLPAIQDTPTSLGLAHTPKTIDDHFYMTNEHLDVVGKSTWDQIETMKKEQAETFNQKHTVLVTTVEKYVQDIKMQVDSVNGKADRTTEQSHNTLTKLDELFGYIKDDVMDVLVAQDKKLAATEQSIEKLHQTMQKILEQRQSESTNGQQCTFTALTPTAPKPTSSPFPLPAHRSQPSLAGYYGNMPEPGREGQPPMPHMLDLRAEGQDGHSDARAGYGYGRSWAPRNGYPSRNNRDERYSGGNPYHFAGNGVANGQFNNGYNGGYSGYNFSPGSPEQHYGSFQGQA